MSRVLHSWRQPKGRRLEELLRTAPHTIDQLTRRIEMSNRNVSRALARLRELGVLREDDSGWQTRYYVKDQHVA